MTNSDWLFDRGIACGNVLARGAAHDTLWVSCATQLPPIAAKYGLKDSADQSELRHRIGEALSWQRDQLPDHVDRVVLSCANLYGAMTHPDAIGRLYDLLRPHFDDMELLVYVRRQDDAILADYVSAVRSGQTTASLADHAETCMDRERSRTPYLYYKQQLTKWLDVWGDESLILRRYAETDFIDGNLIADVLGVLLETWDPDLRDFTAVLPSEHPLSAPALVFLRRLSETLGTMTHAPEQESSVHPILRRVQPLSLPATPRPIMPASLSQKIMAHFSLANRWLSTRFTSETDEPFFGERWDHPEFGNTDTLSADDAVALSAFILDHLVNQARD